MPRNGRPEREFVFLVGVAFVAGRIIHVNRSRKPIPAREQEQSNDWRLKPAAALKQHLSSKLKTEDTHPSI